MNLAMVLHDPDTTRALERCSNGARTLLETMMWGWLLGQLPAAVYFQELEITQLDGPGYVTDDFEGVP